MRIILSYHAIFIHGSPNTQEVLRHVYHPPTRISMLKMPWAILTLKQAHP